jgi:hypothetical protein
MKKISVNLHEEDFINFQDDFYNLLEKYGVKEVDGDHTNFDEICVARNFLADFIHTLKMEVA